MSLKAVLTILLASIIIVVGVLVSELIQITSFLDHEAKMISSTAESIHVSEELQHSLLLHSRDTYLDMLDGKPLHTAQRLPIQKETFALIKLAETFIGSDQERLLVEDVRQAVANYLEMSRQLDSSNLSTAEKYKALRAAVDRTVNVIDRLTELNLSQSREAQANVDRQSRMAKLLGTLAIGITIVIILGVIFTLFYTVYFPTVRLKSAMTRYGLGASTVRASVSGLTEIQDIARTFNSVAEQLEEKRQLRLKFIASIAHDLRNPLSAMGMASELLQETTESKTRELAKIVHRQVKGLDRLVGDLLDTTRIEAGHLELNRSEVSLSQILRNSVELYRTSANLHSLELELPAQELVCSADPERITQVVNNLLSNAVKYSPNGGVIRVSLKTHGDAAKIQVTDQGIGIAEDDLDNIFKPFNRSKATRETIPGIGLGLSASRRIIEAHQGTLTVHSRLHEGSTFEITLPGVRTKRANIGSVRHSLSPPEQTV